MIPKISIVVPVFNAEKYLSRCIDSILNQYVKNIEIILVNDGSTDKSADICNKYAIKYGDLIKVIHQKNQGVSAARNEGIKIAKGKYISFIDSDDWVDKEMYAEILDIFNKHNVDFVKCSAKRIYKDRVEATPNPMEPGYYDRDKIIKEIYPRMIISNKLATNAIVSASTCVYNLEFIRNNNILFNKNIKHFEDLLFNINVIINSNSFYYMKDNYFYNYFCNDESVTQKLDFNKWIHLKKSKNEIENFLVENNYIHEFKNQINLFTVNLAHIAIQESHKIKGFSNRQKYIYRIMNDKELIKSFKKQKITDINWKRKFLYTLIRYRCSYLYTVISYKSNLYKLRLKL